jgi:hypothetical protein
MSIPLENPAAENVMRLFVTVPEDAETSKIPVSTPTADGEPVIVLPVIRKL